MSRRRPLFSPEVEIRDGRQPIACPDCGAYLQWCVVGIGDFLRCPWAHPDRWTIETHTIPKRIFCGKPLQGSRVIGGMSVQSVV